MSTASTSSALEGYTFHIDQGQGSIPPMPPIPDSALPQAASSHSRPPPSSANGKLGQRQRASLDTLALTADLSAFPLNFDEGRGSFGVSK
ncbi:hypothetical protein EW145_g3355 [Phellinidium pouzarii]|uniref:Uncharacterized protein n=1 Tax=Phellinidium pouzarii TaxID=167371 RepID=A0A4S4L7D3_9AGAM|nr:hypothetical protein EW145_g3355 [Phellinidium pouzarii]